ncbi:MAG: C40 family peptidase [Candidatus Eremiobacteraeota bacterium]|nr:C40 family peptidase [Candidatus Eremiobacteraeota bacterium]
MEEELLLRSLLAAGLFFVLVFSTGGFARASQIAQHVPAIGNSASADNTDLASSATSAEALPAIVETQPAYEHAAAAAAAAPRTLTRLAVRVVRRASTIARALTRDALRFLGTPYVFGGTSGYGFDCSGYVQHVFAMAGVYLPRTADAQYYAGSGVSQPRAGDLVFFQTYEAGPSHVGIYLGGGRFVHASSSRGVMVSSLGESYWSARYIGAKRFARKH